MDALAQEVIAYAAVAAALVFVVHFALRRRKRECSGCDATPRRADSPRRLRVIQ